MMFASQPLFGSPLARDHWRMSTDRARTHVRLLGDPALLGANGSVRALERRSAGLLALVSLEPGVTRARAAALLWPDSDGARQALRQQIARFKRTHGTALIEGDDALFIADDVSVDVRHDDAAPDNATGELLGTLHFDDCPDFALWLEGRRQLRRGQSSADLTQQLAAAEAAGDLDGAVRLAEQMMLTDSDSEAYHRTLMRLHYLRGDIAKAQRIYDRLARQLRLRYGARPSAETEALARALRTALTPARAAPVAASVPVTVLRPPRMIGRQRELSALRAAQAERRVALLLGEPGLGKSRLLAELTANAPRCAQAAGRPGDAGVPYATLVRLLRAVLAARPDVMAAGDERRTALARLLPELAPALPLPADGQRVLLHGAVEGALASAGLDAIVIDDLHFADDASCEMLQALIDADALADLRWTLAQRPGEGPTAAARLRDTLEEAGRLDVVRLAPLDVSEMAELIDSLGLPELDGAALAPMLVRHTGGNPLYALETLKHGLALGLSRDGALNLCKLPLPDSVGALIERRLRQLPERALSLARVAAVAGVDFSIALAEDVTGVRAVELASAWAELEAAQVLREQAFAHDLVQDAVLRSIPAPIARHLHGAVAAFLERGGGVAARVAAHWLAAGRDVEAAAALERASAQVLAAGRAAEAGRFLREAAAACDRLGEADRAFDLLFHAAYTVSLAVSIDDFEPLAAELLTRARNDAQRAAALLTRVHVLLVRDQYDAARAPAEQALAAARRAQRRDLEAELLLAFAHFHKQAGDGAGIIEVLEQAVTLLRAEGLHESEAAKLTSLAAAQVHLGRLQDALRTDAYALERYRALNIKDSEPVVLSAWGLHCLMAGDGGGARQRTAQAQGAQAITDPGIGINEGHHAQLIFDCVQTWGLLGETAAALRTWNDLGAPQLLQRFGESPDLRTAQALLMLALGRADLAAPALARLRVSSGQQNAATDGDLLQLHEAPVNAAAFWASHPTFERAVPNVLTRCMWLPMLAVHAPPERALHEIERLLPPMRAEQALGAVIPLLAAQALILARAGRVGEAAIAGAECAALAQSHAAMADPMWVALACAEALSRCGVLVRAQPLLERAAALARDQAALLPDEYRDAYVQRNPLVRAVLAARPGGSAVVTLPSGPPLLVVSGRPR
jgi:DNA-binding SARP family transcriptional activator